MQLNWKTSSIMSACHAGWVLTVDHSRVTTRGLAESELAQAVHCNPANSAGLQHRTGEFWIHLLEHATNTEDLRDIASSLCQMEAYQRCDANHLFEWLQRLEVAFRLWRPNFERDIQLRIQPIRSQWESFGPGLLYQLKQVTGDRPAAASIQLVEPVAAGLGLSYPASDACHFEAVLTDSLPNLPEVLRLAWHLSQLGEENHGKQPLAPSRYALLALVVSAGAEIGLCAFDGATVESAIQSWCVRQPANPHELANLVINWWDTFNAEGLQWSRQVANLLSALQ